LRLRRPLRLIPTALGAALLTLVITVGAAVMPSGPTALAATPVPPGSVTVTFVGAGVWGGSLHSTYALTNRAVSAQFFLRKEWWGTGGSRAPVTAVVERRSGGGSWKATKQRVTTRSATFGVHLPAYSTSSSAHDITLLYRLRVRAGGVVGHGDTSAAITIHYRNPARFTGATERMYRAVHRYCPSALVRIVALSDAAGDYTTGQYALRIDSSVTRYPRIDQRAVALHECGHYLQWRNYGASSAGWDRMTRDAKAVFGTNSSDPVEHMADCIAQAANPGGYLGYGGDCTKAQLASSKLMLAGHRAR
jgi:hypothetical protein